MLRKKIDKTTDDSFVKKWNREKTSPRGLFYVLYFCYKPVIIDIRIKGGLMHYVMFVAKEKGKTLAEIMHPFDENCEDEGVASKEIYCKAGEYLKYYESEIDPRYRYNLTNKNIAKIAPELVSYSKKILTRFDKTKEDNEKLAKLILKQEGGKMDSAGNLYYMCNYNARWDWYSVGGRWNDYLMTNDCKHGNKFRRKDIDLKAIANWENEKFSGEKPLDKFRPYGYLENGKWVDCDDFDANEFEQKFDEWWETLDPETEIVLVDCHI